MIYVIVKHMLYKNMIYIYILTVNNDMLQPILKPVAKSAYFTLLATTAVF
jgi:hypothetical protein